MSTTTFINANNIPKHIDSITVLEEEMEPKDKKHNLPAKFFKNMVFGYWLLLRLKEDNVIQQDAFDTALADFLKPFASINQQNSLYEWFEGDFKILSKDLKKMTKDKLKPTKEKKEKKVNDKIKKVVDAESDLVSRIIDGVKDAFFGFLIFAYIIKGACFE